MNVLGVGFPELLFILIIAFFVLGPNSLPDISRQLGKSLRQIRSTARQFAAGIEGATAPVTVIAKDVHGRTRVIKEPGATISTSPEIHPSSPVEENQDGMSNDGLDPGP